MKITKIAFLQILAKQLFNKLGAFNVSASSIDLAVQALLPSFNLYSINMRNKNILDDEDRIDIDSLEKEATQFFSLIPIINLPFQNLKLSITSQDMINFINELKKNCDIDEVIYLPCQK